MTPTKTETSSLEEQLLRLRDAPVRPERAEMMRVIVSGLLEMHRQYGVLPDSAPGIREDRDRRG
jgi:hypothetical protein